MLFGLTDTSKRFPLNAALPMVFFRTICFYSSHKVVGKDNRGFLRLLLPAASYTRTIFI